MTFTTPPSSPTRSLSLAQSPPTPISKSKQHSPLRHKAQWAASCLEIIASIDALRFGQINSIKFNIDKNCVTIFEIVKELGSGDFGTAYCVKWKWEWVEPPKKDDVLPEEDGVLKVPNTLLLQTNINKAYSAVEVETSTYPKVVEFFKKNSIPIQIAKFYEYGAKLTNIPTGIHLTKYIPNEFPIPINTISLPNPETQKVAYKAFETLKEFLKILFTHDTKEVGGLLDVQRSNFRWDPKEEILVLIDPIHPDDDTEFDAVLFQFLKSYGPVLGKAIDPRPTS